MWYRQFCSTQEQIDVAREEINAYKGIAINVTCTVATGLTLYFDRQDAFQGYCLAYAEKTGEQPVLHRLTYWSLPQIQRHLQTYAPVLSQRGISSGTVTGFFQSLFSYWYDLYCMQPYRSENKFLLSMLNAWRDQLASDMREPKWTKSK